MSETTERNKAIVLELFDKVINGGDVDRAPEFYKVDYIQHNPNVKPGLAGIQGLLRAMHASGDPMHAEIKLMNAEDDMVWLLLEWSGGTVPEGMPRLQLTAEIFRMEDGMMAEHWDVLQFEPKRK